MTLRTPRRGYAMLIVVAFLALLLMLSGVSQRLIGSALRLEDVDQRLRKRGEGSVHAMAAATTLLETGLPPYSPYVCAAEIDIRKRDLCFPTAGYFTGLMKTPSRKSSSPIAKMRASSRTMIGMTCDVESPIGICASLSSFCMYATLSQSRVRSSGSATASSSALRSPATTTGERAHEKNRERENPLR